MKYVICAAVLLGTAIGVVVGLDVLTWPSAKVDADLHQQPSADVRQIPIARATSQSNGDPNGQLTPIYPASPGKDLPVQQAPVIAATPPAAKAPVETTGSAPASSTEEKSASAANAANTAPATPNSCHVQACAATYHSFRASDCSYQPFDGPRKFCDAGANAPAQALASPAPAHVQATPERRERSAQGRKSQEEKDLQDAIRTVRSLPDAERGDDAPVEASEPADGGRYDAGPRWVIEPR